MAGSVGSAPGVFYGGAAPTYTSGRMFRGGYGRAAARVNQQHYVPRDAGYYYYYAPSRVAGGSYYGYPVGNIRPRTNVAVDRYAAYDEGRWTSVPPVGVPRYGALERGRKQVGGWRQRRQQNVVATDGALRKPKGRFGRRRGSFMPGRQQQATSQSTGEPAGSRRQAAGGRRGRGGKQKVVNEDSLNAQLDAYMGTDVAKSRLDNQLDAYFERNGPSGLDKTASSADPLHDPTDIAMDGGSSSTTLSRPGMKPLSNGVTSV